MFRIPNFEIIVFTDPVCSWAWGSEPVLKKLKSRFPKKIKISYVSFGLIEDIRNYRDDKNDIGGDIKKANSNIGNIWAEVSKKSKMPICTDDIRLFSDEYPSTYPANVAYYAAKIQSEKLAKKFLRRMTEAALTEGSRVTNPRVLIELANCTGLKIGQFIEDMESGSALRLFEEDKLFAKQNKINTFPSFLIRNNYNGKSMILRGYQTYENFKNTIQYLSDEALVELFREKSEADVVLYLKEEIKSTVAEIQAIFNYTDEEMTEVVNYLKQKGYVETETLSGGSFIYYLGKPMICDPETNICIL